MLRLLLHVCCGPCAIWPITELYNLCVTGLFYNPNIHPVEEFAKRLGGVKKLFTEKGAPLIVCEDYMQDEWEAFEMAGGRNGGEQYLSKISNLRNLSNISSLSNLSNIGNIGNISNTGNTGLRCAMCYRVRLSYTAKLAFELGFDAFSTTLLISPYQNHELIAAICVELSSQFSVDFFYRDFRPHFRKGQKLARDAGLYRQKYCGCIFSILQ